MFAPVVYSPSVAEALTPVKLKDQVADLVKHKGCTYGRFPHTLTNVHVAAQERRFRWSGLRRILDNRPTYFIPSRGNSRSQFHLPSLRQEC